jgi:hypothetical protein
LTSFERNAGSGDADVERFSGRLVLCDTVLPLATAIELEVDSSSLGEPKIELKSPLEPFFVRRLGFLAGTGRREGVLADGRAKRLLTTMVRVCQK